jgi:hypothetical protein
MLSFLIFLWIWNWNYNAPCIEPFSEETTTQGVLLDVDATLYRQYFQSIFVKNFQDVSFKPDKIFVSIPSYRDEQCNDTVLNLIRNADHPEHLHLVICQQNCIFDQDCIQSLEHEHAKVNIERLHYIQAKGPNYARWRIQQKYDGEEYYLQIDSHTRLIDHWDTILKEQLRRCPSEKSILSQYPLTYEHLKNKNDRNDPTKEKWDTQRFRGPLYVKEFGPEGFTRLQSDYSTEHNHSPLLSCGIASGFVFTKGQFIKDVPLDPYLYLFFGEQMDHMIRAWCAGYDMYVPTLTIAFHIYDRGHRKTFWELTHQKPLEILSRFRLYFKLGKITKKDIPKQYHFILIGIDKWKIQGERTLEEFEKFAGIDVKSSKLKH